MSRIATASLTIAAVSLTLIGCEDSVAPFSTLQTRPTMSVEVVAPTTLVLRTIRPDSTDARIKQWVAPHYVVIDPAARPNGKLFVFFPGGNSTPADNTILAKEAARLGYRVIGLTYATSDPAKPGAAFGVGRCSTTTAQQPFHPLSDYECQESFRLELLDGLNHSNFAPLQPQDGIENRLEKLLQYLARRFAYERWSAFLEDDGSPRWSEIAVGGFSLGGGEAALIAKRQLVDRVVMLAAPLDGFATTDPGPWTAGTWVAIGATPLNRYFGLAHLRDVNYTSGAALANWTRLGLVSAFGPPELQDGNEPPYGGGQTHLLLTNLTPQGGACPTPGTHRSVAEDLCTPLLADGSPALRQAWTYLLTLPYDAQFDTP